ncbi:PREDICTED: carbonyl reductase [NADPH] 3-like [Papilio xuthus]|uniref:Carbonyl reductase [NADPH] 1 n=1 Tax=Papilio xuthus TaxID=66420 RepID=A0A194PYN6_PAPXU|nr:PREDICTED: carbonyl reductase [NADPH] 3-like [Papilio xuthus]KPI98447.1 Carbonyl reductase [NADPH] 1 [Papilio xuthus]
MSTKVAVVTGSNKGIGLSIVKGLCKRFDGVVYLTSRDESRGKAAVENLNAEGLFPEFHLLDIADRKSVERFRDHIKEKYDGIDILINNAGVSGGFISTHYDECKSIININFNSILILEELIFPLVRDNGRILNISSDCGHLSNIRNQYWIEKLSNIDLNMDDIVQFVDWFLQSVKDNTFNKEDLADGATAAAYRVAKVALSAATIVQQRELDKRNISINSMHPGLVRTDMTTGIGFYSADDAAKTPIYLVLDAPASLKGAYIWHDGKVVDWYDYKSDYYFKISTVLDQVPNKD